MVNFLWIYTGCVAGSKKDDIQNERMVRRWERIVLLDNDIVVLLRVLGVRCISMGIHYVEKLRIVYEGVGW